MNILKPIAATTSIFILLVLASCNNAEHNSTNTINTEIKSDTSIPAVKEEPVNKFAGISFASNKDTICGMPLTAGVEDTLQVDGKIYGFCATECKEEFAKQLTAKKSK